MTTGELAGAYTQPPPVWDEVEIGDEIAGPEKPLGWIEMVLQISGSQDWNKIHLDPDYARASGHTDVFFNTGWTSATLCQPLTDWIGTHGWLKRIEFRMKRMIGPGDTVHAKGKVKDKRLGPEGDALIDLEVWLETDRHGVTTTGTATVVLPRGE